MLIKPMVPLDFEVPRSVETEAFRLRKLTVHDVVKDYEAVITSAERLEKETQDVLHHWPRGLTLTQSLVHLGWHQNEFEVKASFAYTVIAHDESQILGCVYITPPYRGKIDPGDYDAAVTMWVRDSAYEVGLDEKLFKFVKKWIKKVWPFNCVAYPVREIAMEEWVRF